MSSAFLSNNINKKVNKINNDMTKETPSVSTSSSEYKGSTESSIPNNSVTYYYGNYVPKDINNWMDNLDYTPREYYIDDHLGLLSPDSYFNNNFSPISDRDNDHTNKSSMSFNEVSPDIANDSDDQSNSIEKEAKVEIQEKYDNNEKNSNIKRILIPAVYDSDDSDDDTDDDIINVSPTSKFFATETIKNRNTSMISFSQDLPEYHNLCSLQFPVKRPRGRKGLTPMATDILTNWIVTNAHNPYPSQRDKERLAMEAGLSVKQVVDWMTNMRKRRLNPVIQGKRPPKTALDFLFLNNNPNQY